MGRPRKNPLINPILPSLPNSSQNDIKIEEEKKKEENEVKEVKEIKKRGRKKTIETDLKELNEGMEKISLDNKPDEPVKKKRVLKKQNKTNIEEVKIEQNIQEMMKDINDININDFIVDNNLNNQIIEKELTNEINDNRNIIEDEKYNEKINELNNYLENEKELISKYKNGNLEDLKLIGNKTLYFYVYFNNFDNNKSYTDLNYIKTKKFILGISTYERINEYSYFTSINREDCIYENEIKINIAEFENLDLVIRILKSKPLKSEIENDKWNIHLIEYQKTKVEMTLKEVLEKVLTKNTWKYYETKENINFTTNSGVINQYQPILTLEKTLTTDNTYFLSKKVRCMIDDNIYVLDTDYRYIFEKIFENLN